MPIVNGELVKELVKEALIKNPQINKTGISGDDGSGMQPHGFAAKQLLNAGKGKELTPQKLEAIAKRLGELVGKDIKAEELVQPKVANAESEANRGNVWIKKKMIAKAKPGAPAINNEEGGIISINIGMPPKD